MKPHKSVKFRLRDLKNGEFQIHTRTRGAFEGSPVSIFKKAKSLGINEKQIKLAVNMLYKHKHDYADFGYRGYVLYTMEGKRWQT